MFWLIHILCIFFAPVLLLFSIPLHIITGSGKRSRKAQVEQLEMINEKLAAMRDGVSLAEPAPIPARETLDEKLRQLWLNKWFRYFVYYCLFAITLNLIMQLFGYKL